MLDIRNSLGGGVRRCLPVLLLSVALAACGGKARDAKTDKADPLTGQYAGSGGSAALAVVKELTSAFKAQHPGTVWTLEDVGSDASIALVSNAETDIGWISRELKAPEKEKVTAIPVGASGTAVAVNAGNRIAGLTKDEVRRIFDGEITDWSQVGGTAGRIRVMIREKEAATRAAFEAFFFDGAVSYAPNAIEVYELNETLSALHSFKDAIGMVTLDSRTIADSQIRLLPVDGVEASVDNLLTGTYKVRRPLYLIVNAKADKIKPAVKEFLDFVRSEEGQRIITRVAAAS
jgi:phosphate transport system substrate-binding protein